MLRFLRAEFQSSLSWQSGPHDPTGNAPGKLGHHWVTFKRHTRTQLWETKCVHCPEFTAPLETGQRCKGTLSVLHMMDFRHLITAGKGTEAPSKPQLTLVIL